MRSQTMVFGAPTRRSDAWRVYQIRTANSLYELEVQEGDGPRRCTVLTKLDEKGAVLQTFEDSQPRIGEKCLYDVSPLDWMGQTLAVGTACTSAVQSVDFIRNSPSRTLRMPAGSSRPATMVFGDSRSNTSAPKRQESVAEKPPAWSPFPLGSVEMVEAAANVLGAVCHRHDLLAALEGNTLLGKRYKLALAQCGVLLETLTNRLEEGS